MAESRRKDSQARAGAPSRAQGTTPWHPLLGDVWGAAWLLQPAKPCQGMGLGHAAGLGRAAGDPQGWGRLVQSGSREPLRMLG